MLHNFKELNIWKKSMDLAKEIIQETKAFPEEFKYSLVSQIVRSSISIPSNISEGSARTTNKEFSRFLDMSQGSACELETLLILAKDLNIWPDIKFDNYQIKINEIQKMIRGFKAGLN